MFPSRTPFASTITTTLMGILVAASLVATAPQPADAQMRAGDTVATAEKVTEGLWLTTEYPEFSAYGGDDVDIKLALANEGLPPQRVELEVTGLPNDWSWEIYGGGHPINAAIAASDDTVRLSLKLTPPPDAPHKTFPFTVSGRAGDKTLSLPIAVTLADTKPAQLTLESKLPALRGTVRSTFDFQVALENEGQENTVVNLLSDSPPGFEVTFKERYGSQELTSMPLKAGESKDLSVTVKPPENVPAGQYPVMIRAAGDNASADSRLVLDITGHPTLSLSGPGGRLSGKATAGEKRTFNFQLDNTGTAPAKKVKFVANAPSGWSVEFSPTEIDEIVPGDKAQVSVAMTPSMKAIAGDYVVAVHANGDGVSDNANFRVSVRTSTVWGVTALGVIGAAVVVLGIAVTRYGRR